MMGSVYSEFNEFLEVSTINEQVDFFDLLQKKYSTLEILHRFEICFGITTFVEKGMCVGLPNVWSKRDPRDTDLRELHWPTPYPIIAFYSRALITKSTDFLLLR
jgi:hypothetical protein